MERGMKNWIIDGIAKEAGAAIHIRNNIVYTPTRFFHRLDFKQLNLAKAAMRSESCLFLHFRPYFDMVTKCQASNLRVFITHIDEAKSFDADQLSSLKLAKRLIFQNQNVRDSFVKLGIPKHKCLIAHGAVSKEVFFPLDKKPDDRYVLISGECKPRKNPRLIREVILANPHLKFIIHGKYWLNFFQNDVPNNVEFQSFDISRQPILMRNASVLLSLSKNEGGPFPLLEALASGTPVVCSRTGFAQEVVEEDAGFILNLDDGVEEISKNIQSAMRIKLSRFNEDLLPEGHNWESFAQKLYLS
jgi:glycosyltransferase involved in cell wall biosynthesis